MSLRPLIPANPKPIISGQAHFIPATSFDLTMEAIESSEYRLIRGPLGVAGTAGIDVELTYEGVHYNQLHCSIKT